MKDRLHILQQLKEGLWSHNPAIISMLGLCPLLAVSNSLVNGLALGVATTFILTLSALLISSLRHRIQEPIRLPLFMFILATQVSLLDQIMEAMAPELHENIGLFIPLIVTNCIILGRMDSYAYRNPPQAAMLDGFFMGLGFSWVLILLGSFREILGTGKVLAHAESFFGSRPIEGITVIPGFKGFMPALMPAGAFVLLGLLVALKNHLSPKTRKPPTPAKITLSKLSNRPSS